MMLLSTATTIPILNMLRTDIDTIQYRSKMHQFHLKIVATGISRGQSVEAWIDSWTFNERNHFSTIVKINVQQLKTKSDLLFLKRSFCVLLQYLFISYVRVRITSWVRMGTGSYTLYFQFCSLQVSFVSVLSTRVALLARWFYSLLYELVLPFRRTWPNAVSLRFSFDKKNFSLSSKTSAFRFDKAGVLSISFLLSTKISFIPNSPLSSRPEVRYESDHFWQLYLCTYPSVSRRKLSCASSLALYCVLKWSGSPKCFLGSVTNHGII